MINFWFVRATVSGIVNETRNIPGSSFVLAIFAQPKKKDHMSKHKPPKKKVVVTTTKKSTTQKKGIKPTVSRSRATTPTPTRLLFGRQHYILMGAGLLLVALGLLLMSGGHMPGPDVWEPERIYSFRRTVLAPIVILAGLGMEIYAIFK